MSDTRSRLIELLIREIWAHCWCSSWACAADGLYHTHTHTHTHTPLRDLRPSHTHTDTQHTYTRLWDLQHSRTHTDTHTHTIVRIHTVMKNLEMSWNCKVGDLLHKHLYIRCGPV